MAFFMCITPGDDNINMSIHSHRFVPRRHDLCLGLYSLVPLLYITWIEVFPKSPLISTCTTSNSDIILDERLV